MPRTRIKICGITRVQDAIAAARAGADAIGMVFHEPAPRNVSQPKAQEILAAILPFVTPVGLFVDASVSVMRETALSLGLRHLQLHGHEDAGIIESLRGFVILKAIRVSRETFPSELSAWRKSISQYSLHHLQGLVLESATISPGGTGIANDWAFIQECQQEGLFEGLPPIIAAGGLTPTTVAAVIRDLHPWAVDVSSGVELTKGIKSDEKILEFVNAVNDGYGVKALK